LEKWQEIKTDSKFFGAIRYLVFNPERQNSFG